MSWTDEISQMLVGKTVKSVTGGDEYIRITFEDDSYQEFRHVHGLCGYQVVTIPIIRQEVQWIVIN